MKNGTNLLLIRLKEKLLYGTLGSTRVQTSKISQHYNFLWVYMGNNNIGIA